MILRLFSSGNWVGSVCVAGLLVAWIDMTNRVRLSISNFDSSDEKTRYLKVLTFLTVGGAVQLLLIIINLIIEIKWINHSLVSDEVSLFTLLLCLAQKEFVGIFISIIKREFYYGKDKISAR